MSQGLGKLPKRYAEERWMKWGEWTLNGGMNFDRRNLMDGPSDGGLGYIGRPMRDAYTHADPVVSRIIALQSCAREMVTDAVFSDLPPRQKRIIWLRYVDYIPTHEVIATIITEERADPSKRPIHQETVRRLHNDACQHLVMAICASKSLLDNGEVWPEDVSEKVSQWIESPEGQRWMNEQLEANLSTASCDD